MKFGVAFVRGLQLCKRPAKLFQEFFEGRIEHNDERRTIEPSSDGGVATNIRVGVTRENCIHPADRADECFQFTKYGQDLIERGAHYLTDVAQRVPCETLLP